MTGTLFQRGHLPLLYLGLFCFFPQGQAQDYRFKSLGLEQGLSHKVVYTIYQDKLGFMWFGTSNGLNRFDGYKMKVWRSDPNNPHALSGNIIYAIKEDKRGFLWVATRYGGVSRFDPVTEQFTPIRMEILEESNKDQAEAWTLAEDKAGRIWVGTQNGGLYSVDGMTGLKYRFSFQEGTKFSRFKHTHINSLFIDDQDQIYVASNDGLTKINASRKVITDIGDQQTDQNFRVLYQNKKGQIWIGKSNGLDLYDPKTNQLTQVLKNPKVSGFDYHIGSIYEDRQGLVWAGTWNAGLILHNTKTNTSTRLRTDLDDPMSITGNEVWAITEDRDGVIWLGTNGGISIYYPSHHRFGQLRHTKKHRLPSKDITSVIKGRDGLFWMGTGQAGIMSWDQEKNELKAFKPSDSLGKDFPDLITVNNIEEDHQGQIWIATWGLGLLRFEKKTETYHVADYGVESAWLGDLHIDQNNILWVGSSSGLHRSKDDTYQTFEPVSLNSPGEGDWVSVMAIQGSTLWIGSNFGLVRRTESEITRFRHNPGISSSLSSDRVYCLLPNNDQLWIGTKGGGLNLFQGEQFTHFTEKDGLPSNSVHSILLDDQGLLWLGTQAGLARFNPINGEVLNWSKADGLSGSILNKQAAYKAQDGTMFFGSNEGLSWFHPNDFSKLPKSELLVFTDLKINNKPARTVLNTWQGRLEKLAQIDLEPNQDNISVEFSALHYSSSARNRYAYYLKNFDDDWVLTDAGERKATYTNLNSGTYEFLVKAAQSNGSWSEPISLTLNIKTPWWLTVWAKALYALLIASFLFLLWYWVRQRELDFLREKQLKEQREELLATREMLMLQDKMATLGLLTAGVAHEINNPTNFVHSGAQSMETELKYFQEFLLDIAGDDAEGEVLDEINRQFDHMHQCLSIVTEGSVRLKDIVKNLRMVSRLDTIKQQKMDLHEGILGTLNLVAPNFKEEIHFENLCTDSLYIRCWPAEINQVFLNLIINGCHAILKKQVKLGSKEPLTMRFRSEIDGNWAVIYIEDEGCGMDAALLTRIFEPFFTTKDEKGTGLGLSISMKIVEKHKGTIQAESVPDQGTIFQLRLPIDGLSDPKS